MAGSAADPMVLELGVCRLAPDADPAPEGECLHPDDRQPRDGRDVLQPPGILRSHDGDASELDLDAFGDNEVDPAHHGDGVDDDLRTFDFCVAEIEHAAAHDGDRIGPLPESPPTLALGATHDRDRPAGRLAAASGVRNKWRGGVGLDCEHAGKVGSERMGKIREHGGEIPERDRPVGSFDPLGELVQRQPAVTTGGLEDFDSPFTVLVGETRSGRAARWRQRHREHCA